MKKVGISTVHTGYNYGSSLQAFATKVILNNLGYEGVNLALRGSVIKGRDVRLNKLFSIAIKLMMQPQNIKKRVGIYKRNYKKILTNKSLKLFDEFREKIINPKLINWNDLVEIGNSCEYTAFLCGSDQIWSGEALFVDSQYYLRYAPKSKRIAFAPSFGVDSIPKFNQKKIKRYLNEIRFLSVREKSGVNIIENSIGKTPILLIDPTLVLSRQDWEENLDLRDNNISEKYIVAYFLGKPTNKAIESVKKLAKSLDLKVINLPYVRENCEWFDYSLDTGPSEFVNLIKYAEFVCTDSFHGTAFAVNFNIPFYTFSRNYNGLMNQSTRITSFLDLIKLSDRFDPDLNVIEDKVDFNVSNEVLKKERSKSIDYLKKSISKVEDKYEK